MANMEESSIGNGSGNLEFGLLVAASGSEGDGLVEFECWLHLRLLCGLTKCLQIPISNDSVQVALRLYAPVFVQVMLGHLSVFYV